MRAFSARSSCTHRWQARQLGSVAASLLACAGFRAGAACGTSDPRRHVPRFEFAAIDSEPRQPDQLGEVMSTGSRLQSQHDIRRTLIHGSAVRSHFRCARPATNREETSCCSPCVESQHRLAAAWQEDDDDAASLRRPSQPRRGTGTRANKQNSRAAKAESRDRRRASRRSKRMPRPQNNRSARSTTPSTRATAPPSPICWLMMWSMRTCC